MTTGSCGKTTATPNWTSTALTCSATGKFVSPARRRTKLQPYLNGPWLVCAENSLGPLTGNARLIHLPTLLAVPVTRTPTMKAFPALADGRAVWQETLTNQSRLVAASLPDLQPVFQNRNTVAVTDAMVAYAHDAYGLLSAWGTNGVQEITEYTSLVPQVSSQTAFLANGVPAGVNFSLVSGSFLWVKFNRQQVLDLGVNNNLPINLAAGANVFGYAGFPDAYSAFQLLGQLGLGNAQAVPNARFPVRAMAGRVGAKRGPGWR